MKRPASRKLCLLLWIVFPPVSLIVTTSSGQAQTYTVLQSFGQGTDGTTPLGGLNPYTIGRNSVGFWGSTQNGGSYG